MRDIFKTAIFCPTNPQWLILGTQHQEAEHGRLGYYLSLQEAEWEKFKSKPQLYMELKASLSYTNKNTPLNNPMETE